MGAISRACFGRGSSILLKASMSTTDGRASTARELDRSAVDHRVHGLDALRLVAALWVVLSHVGTPRFLDALDHGSPLVFALRGALGVLFCGPAAVMVFFVISGFCIHYPYAGRVPFKLMPYLVRRYIRIGLPMAAAMLVSSAVGDDPTTYFAAVLWSLVAELMYYTLYPMVRVLLDRIGINWLLAVSYGIAVLIVAVVPASNGFAVYGWKLNWLVGLPCWLLGVKLAAGWQQRSSTSDRASITASTIWNWRLIAWSSSSACAALNFHSPIGYSWILPWFALVAFAWLKREVIRANGATRPWPILEWAGTWSYSIYLVHMPAGALLAQAVVLDPASVLAWFGKVAFILTCSFVFYLLFEAPSHRLARWASRRV